MFFEKKNGTIPAEEFIDALDNKLAAKVYWILGMIEKNGSEIREPYSKHLDDGIFEARAQVGANLARVLYFFVIGKRVIVTHGFTKKTQKPRLQKLLKRKTIEKSSWKARSKKNEDT